MSLKKFYNLGKFKFSKIYRSITGKGNLRTLQLIKQEFPELKIKSFKSGTKVFDWVIPAEWNVKDAYVKDKDNKKIINFKKNFLHLVGYSIPKKIILSKKELIKRLYTQTDLPDAIPFITSYYKKHYGFCVSENLKKKIIKKYKKKDKFKINIDSSFNNRGKIYYGELVIKGKSEQEILISTYICHPLMANNETSGPIVSMCLINHFRKTKPNKTLRFLFISETIGSISYLSKNLTYLKRKCIGGFNLSCIGDEKMHSYMPSKNKNSISTKSLEEAYKNLKINAKKFSFLERGSDERQYNSPGVDLDIASIFRSKYGKYKEYHTSLDNFDLVTLKGITGGFKVAKQAIINLSNKIIPKSKLICEPNLGKRNLYALISNKNQHHKLSRKLLNFLIYADGKTKLKIYQKL